MRGGSRAGEALDSPGREALLFETVNLPLVPQFGPDSQTHPDQTDVPHLRRNGVCPRVLLLNDPGCSLNQRGYTRYVK